MESRLTSTKAPRSGGMGIWGGRVPKPLTPDQRDTIARDAAARYAAGETWQQIATDHGISAEHVRRLAVARHDFSFRRWGQRPAADSAEVLALRQAGQTIPKIASALGCSPTAVRTALEAKQGVPETRYPRLAHRREPTPDELARLDALYEACPPAPRNRSGHRDTRGPEGRALAEACRELIDKGIPMATLSIAMGRGASYVVWLLGSHDLKPPLRAGRSTSRRARPSGQ